MGTPSKGEKHEEIIIAQNGANEAILPHEHHEYNIEV